MSFVLFHEYSDRSRDAVIIYVGENKAEAFDALMNFMDNDSSQADCGINFVTGPTAYTQTDKGDE